MSTGEKYLQCLIPELWEDRMIYFEDLDIQSHSFDKETNRNIVIWRDEARQPIDAFSEVKIIVSAKTKGQPDVGIQV